MNQALVMVSKKVNRKRLILNCGSCSFSLLEAREKFSLKNVVPLKKDSSFDNSAFSEDLDLNFCAHGTRSEERRYLTRIVLTVKEIYTHLPYGLKC